MFLDRIVDNNTERDYTETTNIDVIKNKPKCKINRFPLHHKTANSKQLKN
jgi:hypothetical protein